MKRRHLLAPTPRQRRHRSPAAIGAAALVLATGAVGAQEAERAAAADQNLDVTMKLLPQGATRPDAVTGVIELPEAPRDAARGASTDFADLEQELEAGGEERRRQDAVMPRDGGRAGGRDAVPVPAQRAAPTRAADGAADVGRDAASAARDAAGGGRDTARDAAGGARDTGRDAAAGARDAGRDAGRDAAGSARDAGRDAANQARGVGRDLAEQARDNRENIGRGPVDRPDPPGRPDRGNRGGGRPD